MEQGDGVEVWRRAVGGGRSGRRRVEMAWLRRGEGERRGDGEGAEGRGGG